MTEKMFNVWSDFMGQYMLFKGEDGRRTINFPLEAAEIFAAQLHNGPWGLHHRVRIVDSINGKDIKILEPK